MRVFIEFRAKIFANTFQADKGFWRSAGPVCRNSLDSPDSSSELYALSQEKMIMRESRSPFLEFAGKEW